MQTNITVKTPLLQSAAIALAFGIVEVGTIRPVWGNQGEAREGSVDNALQELKMVKLASKRDNSIPNLLFLSEASFASGHESHPNSNFESNYDRSLESFPESDIPDATTPALEDAITPDIIAPNLENVSGSESPPPETRSPFIEWDNLEIDISDSLSSSDQAKRMITPVLRGHLANGDRLSFSPGFNRFSLPETEPIVHVPLTLTWEGKINDVGLSVGGGLDIYNRLPVDTHVNAKASIPVWSGATLSFSVEEGPYLANTETIEKGISAWRYGPELYWQIDPKTSFFSLLRLGHFSDGNFEQQSFSRLERKLVGGVAIAAALSTWNFQQDLEETSGYFSPTDFLVGSLELSWETDITKDLHCRVAASLGEQKNHGPWGLGYGHQALCSVDLTPGIGFDMGYSFQNVSDRQSFLSEDSTYNNLQIMGSLQAQF